MAAKSILKPWSFDTSRSAASSPKVAPPMKYTRIVRGRAPAPVRSPDDGVPPKDRLVLNSSVESDPTPGDRVNTSFKS